MSDIICVTNRQLCRDDFLKRVEAIASEKPCAIILREKDLTEASYKKIALQSLRLCRKQGVLCILHTFVQTAIALQAEGIHLTLPQLRNMTDVQRKSFIHIGTSCHSLADAVEAERLGCTYIIAGHIYNTDCKKDLPPRGIDFLSEICHRVQVPIYAIGGISKDNMQEVLASGAKGGCVMSGAMTCDDVHTYMEELKYGQ